MSQRFKFTSSMLLTALLVVATLVSLSVAHGAFAADDFLSTSAGPVVSGAANAASPGAPQASPFGQTFMMFGVIFLIFYFLVIRPQQKKEKQQTELLSALKKGDDVVTSSGIVGRISAIDTDFVTLEVSPNARIKFEKTHVTRRLEEKKKEEKKAA